VWRLWRRAVPLLSQTQRAREQHRPVVAIRGDEILVGETAKRQAITNPDSTISSIKRHMGSSHREVINGKEYSPEEISAMILSKLKKDAEGYLGESVTRAVITVPAYFTDSQKVATKNAGKIAGLEVERIVNEPTSAALSYGLENETEQNIIVYDLGGGTFDVSIINIGDGVIEVLATSGNNQLGGDDFDSRLIDYLAEEFKKTDGIDLRQDKMAAQRLKDSAEKAKKELSSTASTTVNLPFITMDQNGPKHLDITISRAKFDELTADLVDKTMGPVKAALKDSGLDTKDIDKVLLVGGSTRIPAVQEAVKNFIGKEPFKGINPDECVALGAGIQGGKLAGDAGVGDIVLLDVTPLSLGIETLGGIATKLIERNTTIPISKSEVFSTAADGQTAVDIVVVQGEREFARDNKTLGNFKLDGIAPAPRGVPQIEVTFEIDANGIVSVKAKDKGTGREQKITITASSNLKDDEIDKAVKEAEQYAEQDRKRKEGIDAKNGADSLIFQVEKSLKDLEGKIDDSDKSRIEDELANLKSVNDGVSIDNVSEDDARQLAEATEKLREVFYEISSKMYEQAGAEAPSEEQYQENTDGSFDGEVVDGDFEEK